MIGSLKVWLSPAAKARRKKQRRDGKREQRARGGWACASWRRASALHGGSRRRIEGA